MTDELPEKCCGRCKYFIPRKGSKLGYGECTTPIVTVPPCLRFSSRTQVDKGTGSNCPCFEAKETPE